MTVYVWKYENGKPLKFDNIDHVYDVPQWSISPNIPIRHNLTLYHAYGHIIEISCEKYKVVEVEEMTNREYYAANPEKLTGDIWKDALMWARRKYGHDSKFASMSNCEIISEYIDAQHDEEPETTVTTTIEVTEIFKGIVTPSQVNGWHKNACEFLKEVLGADDVQIGNVQRFERGSK